jgi:hypothetical protein
MFVNQTGDEIAIMGMREYLDSAFAGMTIQALSTFSAKFRHSSLIDWSQIDTIIAVSI